MSSESQRPSLSGRYFGGPLKGSESHLDPLDKKMFLREWDLKEGQLTDEQILMAIKTGQL